MRNILARAHRSVLQEFSWSNVLLAFDYDGTLAPIVTDPKHAVIRPETRKLLEEIDRYYPVAVISGRTRSDIEQKLRGVGVSVSGNHGMEPGRSVKSFVAQVRGWLPRIRASVTQINGVFVEDKICSIAVHYRLSRRKKQARVAILRATASLPNVRVIAGKQVFNLIPVGAPHKGVAIEQALTRLRCDTAIYVGDDETDEDVFAIDQPGRLLGIRVGSKRTSAASYYVPNQRAVDALLRTLLGYRSKWE